MVKGLAALALDVLLVLHARRVAAAAVARVGEGQRVVPGQHRLEEHALEHDGELLRVGIERLVFWVEGEGILEDEDHVAVEAGEGVVVAAGDEVVADV